MDNCIVSRRKADVFRPKKRDVSSIEIRIVGEEVTKPREKLQLN